MTSTVPSMALTTTNTEKGLLGGNFGWDPKCMGNDLFHEWSKLLQWRPREGRWELLHHTNIYMGAV